MQSKIVGSSIFSKKKVIKGCLNTLKNKISFKVSQTKMTSVLTKIEINHIEKYFPDPFKEVIIHKKLFPAPQPRSLERENFDKLLRYDYRYAMKCNGERMFLVIRKNKIFFVNRKLETFQAEITINNDILKLGTVIDGEFMINDDGTYNFICHDVIKYAGTELYFIRNFVERYSTVKIYDFGTDAKCIVSKKKYVSREELFEFYNSEIQQGTINDGIIIMPNNLQIHIFGKHNSMFKWKPKDRHTFDFLLRRYTYSEDGEAKEVIGLFVICYRNLKMYGMVSTSSKSGSAFLSSVISLANNSDCLPAIQLSEDSETGKTPPLYLPINSELEKEGNIIVECKFNGKTYLPIAIRNDKNFPNSEDTVIKTHKSISEDITLDELTSNY